MGDFSKTCSQISRRLSAVGGLVDAGSMTLTGGAAIAERGCGPALAITTVFAAGDDPAERTVGLEEVAFGSFSISARPLGNTPFDRMVSKERLGPQST